MFRAGGPKDATRYQGNGAMPTTIGAGFRVKGDISCDGDIEIEGSVQGNVWCRSLTVGGSCYIQGDVSAERVKIQGKIAGNVRAKSIELASSARVAGDLFHDSLTVESGAFINGHCRRLSAS